MEIPNQLPVHFINTREFRRTALNYKKNGGRYTLAPRYSKDWWDFWEEEERRCKSGYSVGGIKITGKHYGYLNFSQMQRVSEDSKGKMVAAKEPDFPSFYEIDYDWWWYKEIAWYGTTKDKLDKLKLWRNPAANPDGTYGGGMHLGCLKSRRAGFSYKEAWDGVHNFHFIDGSKSYYFAAIEQYLTTDGILNKVETDLNFLNQHTDGWLLKNRMEKGVLMHQKASYKDKNGMAAGTNSEIIGVIINDYNKVRGKDGVKITYEEAGSFPNIKAALGISIPSVTDGITLTGQVSIFGTGGDDKGTHLEGLEDIFNDPRTYNILPFTNNWEEGYEATECGVFIPCLFSNPSFMDPDGNVDLVKAEAYEDQQRLIKKGSKDSKDYDRRIAEYPKVPSEALLRVTSDTFPQAEILLQKNRVLRSKELRARILNGEVVTDPEKGVIFQTLPNAKPVIQYPHKDDDDLRSCVQMIEEPMNVEYTTPTGVKRKGVPPDVYLIVVDPFYKDDPKSKTSLGAVYVCKQVNQYDGATTEIDVAWFVGRPSTARRLHEIIMMLAEMYNAMVQSEIAGGGKGLLDYAREIKKLHRICFTPVFINGKEVEKIDKNRSYLMDINEDDKRNGIIYYADYLKRVVGLDAEGREIWNLHYIYDLGLLEELLKYNGVANFDRISAQLLKMFMLKERREALVRKKREKKREIIGKRALFLNGPQQTGVTRVNLEGQFLP